VTTFIAANLGLLNPNVMTLELDPFDAEEEIPSASDISWVNYDGRKLEIVVARHAIAIGRFKGVKFTFAWVAGFRYLDEVDLLRYWRSDGYRGCHHLFSVKAGGWAEEEFKLEGVIEKRHEWLVVTGNGCMNVFSHDAPEIFYGEFDDHLQQADASDAFSSR
jgi:hypothetical protein